MKTKLTGFHKDEDDDWVAELECGHTRHFRHDPPLSYRPWVLTQEGRDARLGITVRCMECEPEC